MKKKYYYHALHPVDLLIIDEVNCGLELCILQ